MIKAKWKTWIVGRWLHLWNWTCLFISFICRKPVSVPSQEYKTQPARWRNVRLMWNIFIFSFKYNYTLLWYKRIDWNTDDLNQVCNTFEFQFIKFNICLFVIYYWRSDHNYFTDAAVVWYHNWPGIYCQSLVQGKTLTRS